MTVLPSTKRRLPVTTSILVNIKKSVKKWNCVNSFWNRTSNLLHRYSTANPLGTIVCTKIDSNDCVAHIDQYSKCFSNESNHKCVTNSIEQHSFNTSTISKTFQSFGDSQYTAKEEEPDKISQLYCITKSPTVCVVHEMHHLSASNEMLSHEPDRSSVNTFHVSESVSTMQNLPPSNSLRSDAINHRTSLPSSIGTKAISAGISISMVRKKNQVNVNVSSDFNLQNSASDEGRDAGTTIKPNPPDDGNQNPSLRESFSTDKNDVEFIPSGLETSGVKSPVCDRIESEDILSSDEIMQPRTTVHEQCNNERLSVILPSTSESHLFNSEISRKSMVDYCGVELDEEEKDALHGVPLEFAAVEAYYRRSQTCKTSRNSLSIFESLEKEQDETADRRNSRHSSIVFKKSTVLSPEDPGPELTKQSRVSIHGNAISESDLLKDNPLAARSQRSPSAKFQLAPRFSLNMQTDNGPVEDLTQPNKELSEGNHKWTGVSWATIDSTELSRGLKMMGVESDSNSESFALYSGDGEIQAPTEPQKGLFTKDSPITGTPAKLVVNSAIVKKQHALASSWHFCSIGLKGVNHEATPLKSPNVSRFLFLTKRRVLQQTRRKRERFQVKVIIR